MDRYDFIVVGAGSAGCAVAGRLSESGKCSVLLLEAGPRNTSPWLKLPIGYGKTFYDPTANWMYETEPVPGFGGRTSYWPRGKVLGGSSSINAMVYSRGQPSDYDEWEALGNPGWRWKNVLGAYRRMEDHDLGDGPWHGSGGPLHVTTTESAAHPLTRLFVETAEQIGLAFNPDLNGATIEGVGYYQITTRAGLRESSATAYLKRRRNLRVLTEIQATRLLFDGRRAIGIRGVRGNEQIEFRANREVILCAGAIGSPQLLLLSGIGPAGPLRDLGIDVTLDSAMVGRNLQDHLCYDHIYRSHIPSLNDVLRPWAGRIKVGLRYLLFRDGPLSLSLNQGGGFYRSGPAARAPDMQLYVSPLSYERAPPKKRPLMSPDPFSGFNTSISPCKPRSVGHLELRSPNWRAAPSIHPNYLSDPHDIAQMLSGARFLRRLAAAAPLAPAIEAELKPGAGIQSDEELIADIRDRAYSVFHPVGTCRMGPDPASAVVDARLRVYGMEALRVADASIFPVITSGNTNAPAIMTGEQAARIVLEDHGQPRGAPDPWTCSSRLRAHATQTSPRNSSSNRPCDLSFD